VMLESDGASVQAVALAVGYEDVSFFRTLFKRITGMTPAEYRARFAAYSVRQPESIDLSRV
jgi:AraC-like DNA-binding protein